MSNPMLNNFLASFKGADRSPLYGKPLIYLIGASGARAIPGSVVEGPYGCNVTGTDFRIAYGNFFDETNSGDYGPYLSDSDTAKEYDEGQIDPTGEGWLKNLTTQFTDAANLDYRFMELDNPDAYGIGPVVSAMTMAHGYGLAIIAKNPLLTKGAPQIITHNNVAGVIVERDAGTPAAYDELRRRARKDGGLPIWFVFDGRDGADECAAAIKAGKFKGMSVTYSTGWGADGYNDSHTVLLPTV